MNKIKLELSPYNATAILKFCREYINDDVKDDYRFKAICDAINEFEKEIYKMSLDQLDDAIQENEVNKIIGKWPTN